MYFNCDSADWKEFQRYFKEKNKGVEEEALKEEFVIEFVSFWLTETSINSKKW